MNSYSLTDLIIIGIGAFVLIRAVLGGYRRAFERDRKLGRFIMGPLMNDSDKRHDMTGRSPDEPFTARDRLYIAAGILLQVLMLVAFVVIIDR